MTWYLNKLLLYKKKKTHWETVSKFDQPEGQRQTLGRENPISLLLALGTLTVSGSCWVTGKNIKKSPRIPPEVGFGLWAPMNVTVVLDAP